MATTPGIADETNDNIFKVLPYLTVAVIFALLFVISSLLDTDWAIAKPWVGVAGAIASFLGVISAAGLMQWLNIPFITINIALPFIMLGTSQKLYHHLKKSSIIQTHFLTVVYYLFSGIGLDDAYVLLAAWRRTPPNSPVPERLAIAYSEASVSISLTSFTDMASFFVGIYTPMPSIQIFSVYAGTTMMFIYLWQLFLFGGCLAISGYEEQKGAHGFFFWKKVVPKENEG